MNLLQSIMGCVYIIRTESIESMEHDCRFQAANIDEQGNEISRGELHVTNDDLIYFEPSRFPTRWPLNFIRRYGCANEGRTFVFEVGRKCSTGQAVFAFRLSRSRELADKIAEKISEKVEAQASSSPTSQNAKNTSRITSASTINSSLNQESLPTTIATQAQRRRDASTSTEFNRDQDNITGPRPLSYSLIDFDTTRALNESAMAHAANRVR